MFTCSSSRPSGCFSVPTTGHCSPGDWIVPSKIKWDLTNGPLRKLRSSYSILRFRGLFSGSCWRFLGIDSPCWECCFSYTLVLTDQEIGYCTFPQKFNPDLWSKKMDKLNLVICCTISSHISYHIISYHIMSCHVISYHTIEHIMASDKTILLLLPNPSPWYGRKQEAPIIAVVAWRFFSRHPGRRFCVSKRQPQTLRQGTSPCLEPNWPLFWGVDLLFYGSNLPKYRSFGF